MLTSLMKQKSISRYRLAKESGIPYSTLTDILTGKTRLEKCSAETIYKISVALRIPMEDLLRPYLEPRPTFDVFKSSVCHRVKNVGDLAFIRYVIDTDPIRMYYSRGWYREAFYLLAMLDYLSRINDIPLCTRYHDIREGRLDITVYPSSVIAMAAAENDDRAKRRAEKNAIPEFLRFNIVENEVRDVV